MKKIFLYASILAASIGFVSCNEDYTDWADPQSWAQEEAQGAVTNATIAALANEVKYETAADEVELIKFVSASNATEGSTPKFTKLVINGEIELPFTAEGETVIVTKEALLAACREAYGSQAYVTRELKIKAEGALQNAAGVAVPMTTNEVSINFLPAPLPEQVKDAPYYYIGDSQGWNLGAGTPLSDNGDGTWSVTVTVNSNNYFKFAPQTTVAEQNWDGLFGVAEDGSTATTGFLMCGGGAMKIENAGSYVITIDPENFTYSIVPDKAVYFIVGTPTGWNDK